MANNRDGRHDKRAPLENSGGMEGHRPRRVSDGQTYRGPSRNDPVLHQKEPKESVKPVKQEEAIFQPATVGSIRVVFETGGWKVTKKNAHGYLTLKPKGGSAMTRFLRVESGVALPSRKVMLRIIEERFSTLSDVKFIQLHLNADLI